MLVSGKYWYLRVKDFRTVNFGCPEIPGLLLRGPYSFLRFLIMNWTAVLVLHLIVNHQLLLLMVLLIPLVAKIVFVWAYWVMLTEIQPLKILVVISEKESIYIIRVEKCSQNVSQTAPFLFNLETVIIHMDFTCPPFVKYHLVTR